AGGKKTGNCLSAASFPRLRTVTKIQGEVAISGAPFFAYFLWQDKESESAPPGDETGDAPQSPGMKKGMDHQAHPPAKNSELDQH
ncbi:hypothetical protein, partial [Ralstonia sp. A12]|uniref:hypothetical protein n=1 Tax=Ralstonia sp. A12 TaxID=1217052 RepID=UPI001E34943D